MKIISSFSGGRTSAYMTRLLKEKYGDDLIVLFANTGREHNKTLSFVNKCDVEYRLNVVWLESIVHHGKKKGCTHKIVSYNSADRNGKVFEEMIKKYGIPNTAWPHCTRELKLNPIKSWLKENVKDDYRMNIGIRFDEAKRMSKDAEKNSLWYPLVELGVTKLDVNEFWNNQPFDLDLQDYQGNCVTCFKKSNKKLAMLIHDEPFYFDFTQRMESKYGLSGCNLDGSKRVFFRKNMSTEDLFKINNVTDEEFKKFRDYIDEDENSNCSESCEAFV